MNKIFIDNKLIIKIIPGLSSVHVACLTHFKIKPRGVVVKLNQVRVKLLPIFYNNVTVLLVVAFGKFITSVSSSLC